MFDIKTYFMSYLLAFFVYYTIKANNNSNNNKVTFHILLSLYDLQPLPICTDLNMCATYASRLDLLTPIFIRRLQNISVLRSVPQIPTISFHCSLWIDSKLKTNKWRPMRSTTVAVLKGINSYSVYLIYCLYNTYCKSILQSLTKS